MPEDRTGLGERHPAIASCVRPGCLPLRLAPLPLPSRSHGGNFLEAIRTRNQPVSHIGDAVRSDVISQVSDIAIRVGRKIVWDPVKETIVGDDDAARRMRRPMREPWRL